MQKKGFGQSLQQRSTQEDYKETYFAFSEFYTIDSELLKFKQIVEFKLEKKFRNWINGGTVMGRPLAHIYNPRGPIACDVWRPKG
jgi:hypothetical protein